MQITDFNAYTQKAWRLFRMSFHSQFMQGKAMEGMRKFTIQM